MTDIVDTAHRLRLKKTRYGHWMSPSSGGNRARRTNSDETVRKKLGSITELIVTDKYARWR